MSNKNTVPSEEVKELNIQSDISEDRKATLTIEVPVEMISEHLKKAEREFNQSVSIPGFRRGKAPMNMVLKKYSSEFEAFMQEKSEDLTRDYAMEALNKSELKPGGPISLNMLEFGKNKPMKFEVLFPLPPEVKLSLYKGLHVSVNKAEVSDKDIDIEIEALRHKFAILRSIDTPAPGNAKIQLKHQEVDPSGVQLIGKHEEETAFSFGLDMLGTGTDEQLIGIKAGEKRLISTRGSDDATQVPQQVKIITPGEAMGKSDGADKEKFISVEAISVEIPELPEIDEELVKKVDQKLNTVEELRRWIEINLLSLVTYNSRHQLENNLVDKLIEENPFEVNSLIIDSFLEDSAERNKIEEKDRKAYYEKSRPEVENEFKWVLLRDEISRVENIEVTEAEFESELEMIARQTGKTLEAIQKSFSKPEDRDRLTNGIFERKLLEFLKEHAEIETRKMSLDEFAQSSRREDFEEEQPEED